MAYHWYRTINSASNWSRGYAWQCAIPSGSTYRRVRFSWGFTGYTSDIVDMGLMLNNQMTFGLVTTIGNGTEVPPDPITAGGDAAPPTQRWVYWETRAPVATAISHEAGMIFWRDSGFQTRVDTEAQVLATGIPSGDSLNLWASWDVTNSWDFSGTAEVWLGTAVLYSTP